MVDLCRLCASLRKKDVLIVIKDDSNEICQKLRECCRLNIEMEDALPKSICEECMENLNVSYKFYVKVKEAQESLHTLFPNFNETQVSEKVKGSPLALVPIKAAVEKVNSKKIAVTEQDIKEKQGEIQNTEAQMQETAIFLERIESENAQNESLAYSLVICKEEYEILETQDKREPDKIVERDLGPKDALNAEKELNIKLEPKLIDEKVDDKMSPNVDEKVVNANEHTQCLANSLIGYNNDFRSEKQKKHVLKTKINTKTNKSIWLSCKPCYKEISMKHGRDFAKKKNVRSKYYCSGCEEEPYMCASCFSSIHDLK